MNANIFTASGICKKYGDFTALAPTDITIQSGDIYGLVGNNGAGKTTLLKLIAGQTAPTSGNLSLFGEDSARGLNISRHKIGCIIEMPGFFPDFTAVQNLEYYRIQRGITGRQYMKDALAQVHLDDCGKKKFKDFSLGMKQRLGLALALMSHPSFLILDEPINGLDPEGIVELRNLLLNLNHQQKITILISSHILSELENLVTRYGFIERGVMIEQISAKDLEKKCRVYLEICVDKPDKASALIEQHLHCTDYDVLPDGVIHLFGCIDQGPALSSLLIGNQIQLFSMQTQCIDLEAYYLSLMGGNRTCF